MKRLILHAANSCTKFEVSICSRCRDISGGVKFYNVSRDHDHALSGMTWLGLATISPQTKFDVSNYTRYEDMRSGAKCTNSGRPSLGHLGVTQGRQQCHSSIERIQLPIRL